MTEQIIETMKGRLARRHFERGRQYELQQRPDQAMEAYRAACALDPCDAEPWFALGKLEALHGRCEAALTAIQGALDRGGPDPEVLEWRAYVYGRLRRYDEALADYRQILDDGPPVVRVNAGRMLLALGSYDEAEAMLADSDDPAAEALLDALPRYREFRPGEPTDDLRAARYLYGATLMLGTFGDGGLRIGHFRYLLLTPRHAAVTLRRLCRLVASRGWRFDAVGGRGPHHGPVARALADLLGLPWREEPGPGRVLLASAVVRDADEAQALREPWRAAGAQVLDFALGLAAGDPVPREPALLGFAGSCAVPWYRVDASARLVPDEDAADGELPGWRVGAPFVDPNSSRVASGLLGACRAGPDDPLAAEVLAWYVERHAQVRALRWDE
jgi:hypothetical protein